MDSKQYKYISDETSQQSDFNMEDQFSLLDIGTTEQEPLLSVQAQHKPAGSARSLNEDGRSRVHFSVGTLSIHCSENSFFICALYHHML